MSLSQIPITKVGMPAVAAASMALMASPGPSPAQVGTPSVTRAMYLGSGIVLAFKLLAATFMARSVGVPLRSCGADRAMAAAIAAGVPNPGGTSTVPLTSHSLPSLSTSGVPVGNSLRPQAMLGLAAIALSTASLASSHLLVGGMIGSVIEEERSRTSITWAVVLASVCLVFPHSWPAGSG